MRDAAVMSTATIPILTSQFSCIGQRNTNQDAIGYHLDARTACFVISDGVGGNAGGDRAARIAVDAALHTFVQTSSLSDESMQRSVSHANSAIIEQQKAQTEHARMSATLVGLFIDRLAGLARWAHVGDSRLYWFRRGELMSCTEDHSVAQRSRLGATPTLGDDEASGATNGVQPLIQNNLLYRALGARSIVEPTVSHTHCFADGDAFLLCTDGLWQLISQQVMERSLRLSDSAEEWLALLRRAAEAKADKSQDNYSALAVWAGFPQQVTLAGTTQ